MSKEEFREICEAVGGKRVVAEFMPVTVRAVDHWLAGSRRIQPVEEARIRELHRQHQAGKNRN
jgi:hypothetical protein